VEIHEFATTAWTKLLDSDKINDVNVVIYFYTEISDKGSSHKYLGIYDLQ